MLAAAIADEPRFEMDPCEIAREGPSFAVETVQLFRTQYPQARIYYFVGDDNLPELETWKDFANLRDLVQFVVLSRAGMPFLSEFPTITRHIEISSTEIRNRVARGLSVRYLAPLPACELIARLRLYRDD